MKKILSYTFFLVYGPYLKVHIYNMMVFAYILFAPSKGGIEFQGQLNDF